MHIEELTYCKDLAGHNVSNVCIPQENIAPLRFLAIPIFVNKFSQSCLVNNTLLLQQTDTLNQQMS